MSRQLVARALDSTQYEWLWVDRGAVVPALRGDANALSRAAAGEPLHLVVDGRLTRVMQASIPARSQRLAAQAAPYAVEDELAEELDQVHIVCGPASATGSRAVAVISNQTSERLLAPLREVGANLTATMPEFLALPLQPGAWSLAGDIDRVIVRTGLYSGFSSEPEVFNHLANKLMREQAPTQLDLYGDSAVPETLTGVRLKRHSLPQGMLGLMAPACVMEGALDLLPNHYRMRQAHSHRGLFLAGAILVLALVVHLGFGLRHNHQLETELADMRSAQAAVMHEAFPTITRLVNPRVQAAQVVAELRKNSRMPQSVLESLYRIGTVLNAQAGQGPVLDGLNYADGTLLLRVRAPTMTALESYNRALKSSLHVEVVSVESIAAGVIGNLRVQPGVGGNL
ncbi:MAG: hypothetical protein HYX63_04550 [Gammaproteobacteria bacterium]|nr:hypothetical protein [Gammaproteobacteria bacterium]